MRERESGLVFNIQRFSLHDGPGVRTTVFLSGCPLACPWCANPESNSGRAELFFNPERCIRCGLCAAACPAGAIRAPRFDRERIDRKKCISCGACDAACPTAALTLKGRRMRVEEVMDAVRRDLHVYGEDGGVTLSGGEPFFQAGFALALLRRCAQSGLSTCVETTLEAPWAVIQAALPFLKFVYADFKHPDARIHKAVLGADNLRICENLARVAATGCALVVRIPLIPRFNATEPWLRRSAARLAELGVKTVEFLNYHALGESKFAFLGREYAYRPGPYREEEIAALARRIFRATGFRVLTDD